MDHKNMSLNCIGMDALHNRSSKINISTICINFKGSFINDVTWKWAIFDSLCLALVPFCHRMSNPLFAWRHLLIAIRFYKLVEYYYLIFQTA